MSEPPLRIGVQDDCVLGDSIRAAGYQPVILPRLPSHHHDRPILRRMEDGKTYAEFFNSHEIDLLLDIDTSAMTFVREPSEPNTLAMVSTQYNVPYVAHFIDPTTETMKEVDWPTRWKILEASVWMKWVWDRAHARELIRLGIPSVLAMPLAAVDAEYSTISLPETPPGAPVGFVGHPATSWFCHGLAVSPGCLRAGLLAAACNADEPRLTFADFYYDLYRWADPPRHQEPAAMRAKKAADYFAAKFTYNAYLALKQRDRFAIYLKQHLGDHFELIGDDWQRCHGIPHTPRITGRSALNDAYRSVAICLNLIKGNAETGLNLRHFEITAAGGFMLTYKIAELADCFEIGKECVVFESELDLLDKIRYYLAHPKERVEIAFAGQRRTLSEHLYSHRLRGLLSMIRTSTHGSRPGDDRRHAHMPSAVSS